MEKKDGGPAFPVRDLKDPNQADGMTLRDYFAGCALAGMLASGMNIHEARLTSKMSYLHADAMLVERAKE